MRRTKIFEEKLKKAAQLSEKEKDQVKILDDYELGNLIYEVTMTQVKYLEYVQNICQYLLNSCTPIFDIPDELKEEADSIEEDIFMDLKDIRAKILKKYDRG